MARSKKQSVNPPAQASQTMRERFVQRMNLRSRELAKNAAAATQDPTMATTMATTMQMQPVGYAVEAQRKAWAEIMSSRDLLGRILFAISDPVDVYVTSRLFDYPTGLVGVACKHFRALYQASYIYECFHIVLPMLKTISREVDVLFREDVLLMVKTLFIMNANQLGDTAEEQVMAFLETWGSHLCHPEMVAQFPQYSYNYLPRVFGRAFVRHPACFSGILEMLPSHTSDLGCTSSSSTPILPNLLHNLLSAAMIETTDPVQKKTIAQELLSKDALHPKLYHRITQEDLDVLFGAMASVTMEGRVQSFFVLVELLTKRGLGTPAQASQLLTKGLQEMDPTFAGLLPPARRTPLRRLLHRMGNQLGEAAAAACVRWVQQSRDLFWTEMLLVGGRAVSEASVIAESFAWMHQQGHVVALSLVDEEEEEEDPSR